MGATLNNVPRAVGEDGLRGPFEEVTHAVVLDTAAVLCC